MATDPHTSLRFVLSGRLLQSLLGFLDVLQGEFPGLHEVRHHQLGASAEYSQQFVNEAALRILARNDGLEDIGVADSLDATKRLLTFQAIDDRLHGCVSGSARLGKRLLNLANGAHPFLPKRL